ncbi:MAG: hypothetical protein AAF990_19630 [Bacteroidota bacterium]
MRLTRLFRHLLSGVLYWPRFFASNGGANQGQAAILRVIGNWWLELCVYALECLGVGELYETTLDLIKFNTRSLHPWEVQLARSVFGNTINYRRVRIDERAFVGPRQKRFCYVSFYMINAWGPMDNALLIHELVHIWQYERFGAVYMPRALAAQRTVMGYDYGGVGRLKLCKDNHFGLQHFNYEQQGDIIADYYRIREGYKPVWGIGSRLDLEIYHYFVEQLKG